MKLIFNFSHFRNVSEEAEEGEEIKEESSEPAGDRIIQESKIRRGSLNTLLQDFSWSEGLEEQWE